MTISTWHPGDAVPQVFRPLQSGVAFDPTTVRFHYTDPSGTDYTKIYNVDTDVVTKLSTGVYQLVIYVPYSTASVGEWYVDAQALNASAQSIIVEYSVFNVVDLETL